jgi:hypothetical protein
MSDSKSMLWFRIRTGLLSVLVFAPGSTRSAIWGAVSLALVGASILLRDEWAKVILAIAVTLAASVILASTPWMPLWVVAMLGGLGVVATLKLAARNLLSPRRP